MLNTMSSRLKEVPVSETFPRGHFYSPIPDMEEVDERLFAGAFENVLSVDEHEVMALAAEVFGYSYELAKRVNSGASLFEWCNTQFPPADAFAYYGILRKLKPKRVIEVGSGYSTHVAMEAVSCNGYGEITCIEPFPRDFLQAEKRISLIEKKLQDVATEKFQQLQAGDILFVDSSHQVKCQSDVLEILFRVCDALNAGVFIHFHDIFFPDDYPYFWLKESGLFFNEQYFLLAFLKDNPNYRVRLPNAYLVRSMKDKYEQWLTGIHQPANEGFVNQTHKFIKAGSFWIEKLT